jgi:hypothetical protein
MRSARTYTFWLTSAFLSAALAGCGGGGGGAIFDLEAATPHVSVAIVSARAPLIAGQTSTVQAVVVNTGETGAGDVLVQVAAPIGFEYQSVTCLSSGAAICPLVSVQQLAGGVVFPSFPAGTEVSFFFNGVTTGAAGSQVLLAIAANVPGDLHPEDNSAVNYIAVVGNP